MADMNKLSDGLIMAATGAVGAVVSLIVGAEVKTVRQRLSFVFCGLASAYFCAAPAAHYFKIYDDQFVMGLAFLIGVFGASIIQSILRGIGNLDVAGLIRKRLGL